MVLTISHQKGGVGKSTLTYNIAVELSKEHNVSLIDLDVQQTISAYNGVRELMGHPTLPIHILNTDKELIDFINSQDDSTLVIIDSGGFDSELNRIAILASDFIITPVSPEFTEILGLQKYEEILKQIEDVAETSIVTNVILNKVNPNQKNFSEVNEFINQSSNFKLMDTILRRRSDFANSVAYGFSAKELDRHSRASNELEQLIEEIKNKALSHG